MYLNKLAYEVKTQTEVSVHSAAVAIISFGSVKMTESQNFEVSIIGGGLVGSLCACFLGNRGISVKLYELREDIRLLEHVTGRSINLALSERGRSALRRVGLEDEVIRKHGIPMGGRLIHGRDGSRKSIPYGKKGQAIYSVSRRFLNETLLTAAEKNPNVKVHFNQKLINCDFKTGNFTTKSSDGKIQQERSNLIIGCDGAYSAVRQQMLKMPRFNYSQTYIPHGYLELCIPPTKDGEFAMEVNFLHIWPRNTFMMIALPNQDRSYTVTLFMPFPMFESLNNGDKLVAFFQEHFPDSIHFIGRERLVTDFFKTPPSPLVSVKCSPYHVEQRALLMGDAAHAMVPFYGQGLNAGFEDCEILDNLLETYSCDIGKVLPAFTNIRNTDAETICDLAMYNYIEMRDLVTSKKFLFRKKLDGVLNKIFPKSWIPLYSMVTFSKLPYSECLKRRNKQDEILSRVSWSGLAVLLAATVTVATGYLN